MSVRYQRSRCRWSLLAMGLGGWLTWAGIRAEEPARAAESAGPGTSVREDESGMKISLREALLLAMHKNLRIRAAQLTPQILEDDVQQERSKFDTVLSTDVDGARARAQTASQLAGAAMSKTDTVDFGVSATRKLLTGTEVTTEWQNTREGSNSIYAALDPAYTSNLGVSLTQPLLKGRGRGPNEGAIRIAENARQVSLFEYRRVALNTCALTEKLYWDLAFALENLGVQQFSLRQAQQLLRDNQRKAEAGAATQNDVIQAEAEVAEREEAIILAERQILTVEDRLKTVTNLIENQDLWDQRLLPVSEPGTAPPSLDPVKAVEQAFAFRPDYLAARTALESRQIAVVVARNGRYPELDLTASFSLNGVRGNFGNAVDSVASTEFYNWGVGLSMELPFGLRSGRSLLKRRRLEKAQALLRFKDLGNQVVAEVRDAWRNVETAQKMIRTAEVSQRLQEAKLSSGQELFRVGRSTTNVILEFQLDLVRAKSNYLRAVLELRKALVDLERAKGTLLRSRDLAPVQPSSAIPKEPASGDPEGKDGP